MPPIAYITDHYPATSHTFIQREVLALRAVGVDVRTFSIHRVGEEHVLSRADAEAFRTTYALLPPRPLALLAAHAAALLRHPHAYGRTVAEALRVRATTPRARIWQLFYFGEAILLWRRCRRDGIRHVHAHFASPGADVAHLFGRFARRAGRGAAGWSFTGHGTDITDADPGVLAAKVRDADFVVCVSDHGRAQMMSLVEEAHWPKIHVVRCGVDVTATLVGDGPRRAALETLARDLGVADRIRFAGRVGQDHMRRFYAEADIFCLPSFAEGIPVVLVEAMASGVPVVASRITGIPELIEDGTSGVLVPPGRPDRLADAVRDLLADPDWRTALAAAGRSRVRAHFEVGACAEKLRAVMAAHGAVGG